MKTRKDIISIKEDPHSQIRKKQQNRLIPGTTLVVYLIKLVKI